MKYLPEHIQAELGDDGLHFTVPLASEQWGRLPRKPYAGYFCQTA
jgi:hypothetical protein